MVLVIIFVKSKKNVFINKEFKSSFCKFVLKNNFVICGMINLI